MSILTKNIYLKLFFLIFTIFFFIFHNSSQVHAIGLTPPVISGPPVAREMSQQRELKILRSPTDIGKLLIEVEAGNDIAREYFTFKDGFVMPENKIEAVFSFEINPGDLSNGEYEGLILLSKSNNLNSNNLNSNTNQISIKSGVVAVVRFIVTGQQIEAYEIISLDIGDSELNKSISLKYTIKNTGNVNWSPDRMDIVFINQQDSTDLINYQITSKDIDVIKPGYATDQVFQLDLPFRQGIYIANSQIYKDGSKIGELTSRNFTIHAPGTLKQSGELLNLILSEYVVQKNEKFKLSAEFGNTGEVAVTGSLITEINKDGKLLDIKRGEDLTIESGSVGDFVELLSFSDLGKYTLSSYVKYGNNKKTNTLSKTITVEEKELPVVMGSVVSKLNTYIGIGVLITIIIIITTIFILRRRRTVQFSESEPVQNAQNNMIISEIDDGNVVSEENINLVNKSIGMQIPDNTVQTAEENVGMSDQIEYTQTEQSVNQGSVGNLDSVNNDESDSEDINLLDQINIEDSNLDDE
jgi:hypothetical protein